MRRLMFRVSAVAVAALVCAPRALAQNPPAVENLVAQNLAAKGGVDKLKSVQTVKQVSHLTMQGMTATLTLYGKRPNLLRQEIVIAGQTIISAFDGTTPWHVNPLTGSSTPIVPTGPEADAIREQSDFEGPFVDYQSKGYTIEFVGTETTDGRRLDHLKVTSRDQQVQHVYLDASTHLEARVVSDTPMGQLAQELSDYREVAGVQQPYRVRTLTNGVVVSDIVVEKIEINLAIDDGVFRKPAGVQR